MIIKYIFEILASLYFTLKKPFEYQGKNLIFIYELSNQFMKTKFSKINKYFQSNCCSLPDRSRLVILIELQINEASVKKTSLNHDFFSMCEEIRSFLHTRSFFIYVRKVYIGK